jgi:hypothetical protein
VGHQPALPRAAAAPPVRAADAPRGPRRHHLRLRRQDRPLHRPADVKRTLELHPLRPNEPYYLGFFLVGAYQEILGDMHNLFGDPNIVHVDLDEHGRPRITHVVRGDRTQEVLSYVEYFEQDVLARLRRHIERSLEEGRMTLRGVRAAAAPLRSRAASVHVPLARVRRC